MTEPLQDTESPTPHPDDARNIPTQPPTFGRLVILGAVAAIAGTVLMVAWVNQPAMRSYPTVAAVDLAECAYDEASDSANQAAQRYYQPETPLSKTAAASALHETEAAQQKQEDARVCEERKRQDSDLAAQWHSAVAAENTARFTAAGYWWGVIELVFLFMALGAACWAALEGKRAADAAHAQHVHARQVWLAERRRLFNEATSAKIASIMEARRRDAEAEVQEDRFQQQLAAANLAASNALLVGQTQVRAYVNVESFGMLITSRGVELTVTLVNNGQSPALSVSSSFASAEFLFWKGKDNLAERLSCSMQPNVSYTARDIQARKPGIARCDFSMSPELAARFRERIKLYDFNVSASLIVTYCDVFGVPVDLIVRGQKKAAAGSGQIEFDLLSGGEGSRPFVIHDNETRTHWNVPMTPGAVMPPPLGENEA